MNDQKAAIMCIVEMDEGLLPSHWFKLLKIAEQQSADHWIPYSLEAECNSVAYGFMRNDLYDEQFLVDLKTTLTPVLMDWSLESVDGSYKTKSGHVVTMFSHVDHIN
ncbi:hypothetical protein [Paenibacillus glucanolyticus]|uniref:hypothetical protein n=1 Tax=Paenibacillus glucanolyticus TaxID=59843 RepID=UPI00096DC7D1|nr:hypothetical protein [Paenibacillus glucanolyticus]OMF66940.1 hypothetical protein BK142_28720 [Paenibacillus glucanolyticus]